MGRRGEPYDTINIRRFWNWLFHLLPFSVACRVSEDEANLRFDHVTYNLAARHRIHSQHATISDLLPSKILNGTVSIKGDVLGFTEDSVVFKGDPETPVPVDAVILATGYSAHFPFLDSEVVSVRDNRVRLYKYVFPPHLDRGTLAFIGGVQPEGSLFPIAELQSRWAAGVFAGRYRLPAEGVMDADVSKNEDRVRERYISGSRHARQVDWIDYMDELAAIVGCKPRLLNMLLSDPKLCWACVFGPCLPYQFRLSGPRPWKGARQEILSFKEHYKMGLKTRMTFPVTDGKSRSVAKIFLMVFSVLAVALKVKFVRAFVMKHISFLLQVTVKFFNETRLGNANYFHSPTENDFRRIK